MKSIDTEAITPIRILPSWRQQLEDELLTLLDEIDPEGDEREPIVQITREMEAVNNLTVRVFAQTLMASRGEIHLAPQFFELDQPHRLGILAHEIGHLLLRHRQDHTEDEADQVVRDAGLDLRYDKTNWPGKGLQYLA